LKILGLTGSIGMGKSTAAKMFRRLGVPVHDADAAVHRLLARGGRAVAAVDAAFPGTIAGGAVDRRLLGQRVFGNPDALRRLEKIIHPLVREDSTRFLRRQRLRRSPVVVLDIPLLFEGGSERRCDAVLVVTAPAFLQRARVLSRPGMTAEKFAAILRQQTPDREKRRKADFVVDTGLGKRYTLRQLARIVKMLRGNARNRSRHRNDRARSR
jgi:dephospho-CoA kinase